MKAVARILGVASSNLTDQVRRSDSRPGRGSCRRAEDEAVLAEIRAITGAHPTYGYRRVTAQLNYGSSGQPPRNHKRLFRLMRPASMLLQPHIGWRPIRAHEVTVVAHVFNQRWASDDFEVPCWNGEVVRIAFAIDTHNSEIIAWVATSGDGISGEMIRDVMLDCVERRFDAIRTPESNGVCEAFVKTLKRDYVRVNPRRDASPRPAAAPRLFRGLQHHPCSLRLAHALAA